jgi:hypothetical protein
LPVTIFVAIPGVEFDAAWPRRVEDAFDKETKPNSPEQ